MLVFNFLDIVPILQKTLLATFQALVLLFFHSRKFKFLINKNTLYLTLMLPSTILVLTQTIASNLYLSLGLIGALSIVRYRTPVKSQYELAYLFLLIAIGIVSGVNPIYSILLTLFILLSTFLLDFFSTKLNIFQRDDLRFNSNGKVEMNLVIKNSDLNLISLNSKKYNILRIENDYTNEQSIFLLSFDTMDDAFDFQSKLKFKPLSNSIINN